MDHQKTSSTKFSKFLPRATSSVSFQNPPVYSPASKHKTSSDKTHKSNLGIGFSGPMLSLIPPDTRRKINNKSDYAIVFEPTSPRVSCMGQVKCKYRKDKLQQQRAGSNPPADKVLRLVTAKTRTTDHHKPTTTNSESKNKKLLGFKKILSVVTPGSSRRKPNPENKIANAPLSIEKVPTLSSMKRFSSGRGKFSGIDWTKAVSDDDDESDDERVIVPSSAPVVIRNSLGFDDKFVRVAGINKDPKKEINLWKRRTIQQPRPLQLHTT